MSIEHLAEIPNMLGERTGGYCYQIGRMWSGQGVAVELGCWLGYSCACMAEGLKEAAYDGEIHCFDRWRANSAEIAKAKRYGVKLKRRQNLSPVFLGYVAPIYDKIVMHRGPIRDATWDGEPIGLFFLDAAKRNPDFATALRRFGPAWVPGTTIAMFLDYEFFRKEKLSVEEREVYRVQKRFVERYHECFEPIPREEPYALNTPDCNCAFRYTRPIDFANAVIE